MYELLQLADELGLTVIEGRGEHLAGYQADDMTIRLTPGMTARYQRSVLAHEIAHHVFGHRPSPFGPVRKRQERAANEWAARRLITIDAYAEAESLREGHLFSIAADLNVAPELVIAYQNLITRERQLVVA